MSNTFNHIQETETIQSFSQQPKKYWQYVYELRHIPTGFLYVGSRSNQSVLKTYEDCYTDDYLGSSCRDEGPFSKKDTETNPQNYAKKVLKVFHDEDPKTACRHEHGSNGLIMTYWNLYGKDKVLNQHCVLNDGSKVFSNAGQNAFANKTIEEMEEINQKKKNTWNNKPEEEKEATSQKRREIWDNKSEEEKEEISQKKSETWDNKSEEEKEEISQKKSDAWDNKPEEEKEAIRQKQSEASKGENNPMFGQGHKVAGEKNGTYTMFQHPYNPNFKGNSNKISNDIRKNYPNEKQWKQIPRKKRNELKIQKID